MGQAAEQPSDDELALTNEERTDRVAVSKKNKRNVAAAVNLRVHGASYFEIAEVLEYPTAMAARIAVETAMASTHVSESDVTAARAVAVAQLDRLLRTVAPRAFKSTITVQNLDGKEVEVANEQQLNYSREVRAIIEGKARLLGLNAPATSILITPDAEEFGRVIREMASQHRKDVGAEEADVFAEYEEADVVDNEGA